MTRRAGLRPGKRRLPVVVSAALWFACSAAYAAGPTVTQMTYDVGDHVVTVTDPRGLVTTYAHDGLGQLWQQVSPDTGTYNYDG